MKFADIELPSNRTFGLFFAVVFALIGGYCFNRGAHNFAWVLGGLAILFCITAVTKPEWLLPLNKLWMRFGFLLGMIVSPLVLGILFFGLFTPISLSMRLFGRDELRLKPKSAPSYWKVRDSSELTVDSFKHQF